MMLIVVVHFDLEIEQLDVKTAFLHGNLDKLINMEQPARYIDIHHPEHVCLLKKSLYGLKQSPRQWYKKFDNFAAELVLLEVNMIVVFTTCSQISLFISFCM